MSRHLSTGGAATESDTDGGESEDGGQPSTPGGTPIERRVRAASLHTVATVEALEAEGKHVEAAEVLEVLEVQLGWRLYHVRRLVRPRCVSGCK